MRAAILSLAVDKFVEMARLPPGTVIRNVRLGFNQAGTIEFVIEHIGLDNVRQGDVLPNVRAVYGPNGFVEWLK